MSNTPKERSRAHPSDLPEPDGLDLRPPTHLAEDLDGLVESAHLAAKAWRQGSVLDLPEPDTEDLSAEIDELDCGFVLLDEQGLPVPGVSATPLLDGDRNINPSAGEAALRDWRLKLGGRKAVALEAERQQELARNLRGAAGLMAILLACTVVGVRLWRSEAPVSSIVTDPATASVLEAAASMDVASQAEALTAPAIPALPAPDKAAPLQEQPPPPPVQSAPTAELPAPSGSEGVIEGTLKHWTGVDGYLYWQWDYVGTEPVDLQWRDPSGTLRMQDRVCDGRIDGATGRCYVGRSMARFQTEMSRGAEPGTWTLESCLSGECSVVSSFEIQG